MKKLIFLFSVSCLSISYGQDWRDGITFLPATVTEDFCVSLNADQPIAEWYVMDITLLGFTNQEEAEKAFWSRSNNYVTYQVKLDENKAYAKIWIGRTQVPHDITWWNSYLGSICSID